jgi:dihydrofolate reductase
VRSIVVAFAENRGIGYRCELPWRLPSDLRRFRELTIGGTVLMGRKTFESLPDAYRPLPGRRNLVVSRDPTFEPSQAFAAPTRDRAAEAGAAAQSTAVPGGSPATSVEVHQDLDRALRACDPDCFIIGGGSIYKQTLPLADRVYATLVRGEPISDTFFPRLEPDRWQRGECGEELHENGHTFRFAVYDRLR